MCSSDLEMERQGVDPQALSLRLGIFGAEPWTDAMRSEIEARTDIQAVDIYGLSEVIGPGVAQECLATKDGPTIWEDHFYPEVVNPDTGKPVNEGEEGELVFTSLTKEAMPVIRYRTRDLTRLLPGTARTMRRMARITGRSDDMMIIRGVNVFPSQIEEHLLAVKGFAPHYQIELSKDRHMDVMTVNVEKAESTTSPAIADELAYRIKTYVGVTSNVVVHEPGSIPRSEGKAKRVLDNR